MSSDEIGGASSLGADQFVASFSTIHRSKSLRAADVAAPGLGQLDEKIKRRPSGENLAPRSSKLPENGATTGADQSFEDRREMWMV